MSYTAPTKKAIVKPKLDTKYEFKDGGKKTVIADANKTTSLGTYIQVYILLMLKRNRIW